MDLLIVEPLEAEVLQWLDGRHELFYAPTLPKDRRVFVDALSDSRAAIVPPQARIDAPVVSACRQLRALGRIAGGLESIDLPACARAGIEIVRPTDAAAPAEAEFLLGALLALLRPSPEESGRVSGRELGACTVGLVGMTPAARTLARYLQPLGSRLIGYDPGTHSGAPQWERWGVQPAGLGELFEQADAVCVQLPYYSRYKGLLGERVLQRTRPGQVLVSISPLDLFDEAVFARNLHEHRLAAAWLDCHDPGAIGPGRPLHGAPGLVTTPRLGAYTREARLRSAWSVARRVDEVLRAEPSSRSLRSLSRSAAPAASNTHGTEERPGRPMPDRRLDTVPDPANALEVLDLRSLRAIGSTASALRSEPVPARPSGLPVPPGQIQAPPSRDEPAADLEHPRRRWGEDDHLLSRSRG